MIRTIIFHNFCWKKFIPNFKRLFYTFLKKINLYANILYVWIMFWFTTLVARFFLRAARYNVENDAAHITRYRFSNLNGAPTVVRNSPADVCPRTHTRGSERSIRCAVHAHENAFTGRASVSKARKRCTLQHDRVREAVSRGGMKGGEKRSSQGARVASRGWVSHSLSMRVGLRYENTAARQ